VSALKQVSNFVFSDVGAVVPFHVQTPEIIVFNVLNNGVKNETFKRLFSWDIPTKFIKWCQNTSFLLYVCANYDIYILHNRGFLKSGKIGNTDAIQKKDVSEAMTGLLSPQNLICSLHISM
jgi:hypothetical protein